MAPGELLTRWTIRMALVLYVVSVALRLAGKPGAGGRRRARWCSTAGLGAYAAHVAAAFHFYHDWSHDAAYTRTAEETAQVLGVYWGGGLYFNYAFSSVWALDVTWSWIRPAAYDAQPRWVRGTIHGFMAFMAFQGTVVFEAGVVRWSALGATALLLALWIARRRATSQRKSS